MHARWLVVLGLMGPTLAWAADTDSDTDSDTDASTDTDSDTDTYPSGGRGAADLSGEVGGCACDSGAAGGSFAALGLAAAMLVARRRQA